MRELKLHVVRGFTDLAKAQNLEVKLIKTLRPRFNKYVTSSPTRLGLRNSKAHNRALAAANKGRKLTPEHKAKLWENRSRLAKDISFYGKHHIEAAKRKIRAANKRQFADPIKRERHRLAVLKAIAKRRALGLPLGRQR